MYNTPFDVTPDKLAEEAATMQQKLGAGLATLRELDDVHYGVTAKEEVWRDGKVVLYRFRGQKTPTAKVPLLICYALVNRPYMVDLQDDRSLVKNLLALGQDVYLIDWGYTDRSDRFLTLEDYIERFIDGAVDYLREASGQDRINLLGICQGGAFSLTRFAT
jgi:polyhydroxyalkanoate synthase subunit PhaC